MKKNLKIVLAALILVLIIVFFVNKEEAEAPVEDTQTTSPSETEKIESDTEENTNDQESAENTPEEEMVAADEERRSVTFNGGFETAEEDNGIPIILIAAGLNVTEPEMRETLMDKLGDNYNSNLELTDDYIDEMAFQWRETGIDRDRVINVMNAYRYDNNGNATWNIEEAEAYATLLNGQITGFVITKPTVSVEGVGQINTTMKQVYSTILNKNGSISEIILE
jgi:hypothetical protein